MKYSLLWVLIATTSGARADLMIQTGAQLSVNPNVVLPTRSSSVSGSQLSFATGVGGGDDVLLRWKIADAGSLVTDTALSVTANVRRDTNDFDVWFGLYDQTTWVGGSFADNNSGMLQVFNGSIVSGGTRIGSYSLHGFSIAPTMFAVGQSGDIRFDVLLHETTADFSFTFDGTTLNYSRAFNRSAALSVILGLGDFDELLTINSISVSSAAVPEPSSCAIAGGLMIAAWCIRRRQLS